MAGIKLQIQRDLLSRIELCAHKMSREDKSEMAIEGSSKMVLRKFDTIIDPNVVTIITINNASFQLCTS